MGHTAHVVANRMIVIFGHSPKYGYLDTVQEYHFFNKVRIIEEYSTNHYGPAMMFQEMTSWKDSKGTL